MELHNYAAPKPPLRDFPKYEHVLCTLQKAFAFYWLQMAVVMKLQQQEALLGSLLPFLTSNAHVEMRDAPGGVV